MKTPGKQTTDKIDISNNASGMYIIKLNSDVQSKTYKVVRK